MNKSINTKKVIVYCGQAILLDEFDKFKNSIGGLLSFNNFLSTSVNLNVSVQFAIRAAENSKVNAVLCQMTIDPKKSSVPFAYLKENSSYKYENEILFTMHTILCMMDVQHIQDQYWLVNLNLTSGNDQTLKILTDRFRK
ncbi:unnamed protein product [Rotaria sp. Silwood2]|nr:unnamed protein product [Rotaria sp. Silwood2]CAF3963684.1 unnamed protein product [Rotaria sp. Silwood2]